MEEEEHTYVETQAATLLSHQAQYIVAWGMLAFMSDNFPWSNPNNIVWDVDLLANLGCFFLFLPVYDVDVHPRVSVRRRIGKRMRKVTMFAHIVCRVAWGQAVPEKWSMTDKSAFCCSHLCEAFWRWFFDQHGLSEQDYWIPSRWCISPICVHVERTFVNYHRRICRRPTPNGCQCGSQPPCLYFPDEVVQRMTVMWEKYKFFFKKLHFEQRMENVTSGWTVFTPQDFEGRPNIRRHEVSIAHLEEDGTVEVPDEVEGEKALVVPHTAPSVPDFIPTTREAIFQGLSTPGRATTASLLHAYLLL